MPFLPGIITVPPSLVLPYHPPQVGLVGTYKALLDLNLLTIHGKSKFPGLYVWLRNGRRVRVKVPDGCLLIQVGPEACVAVHHTYPCEGAFLPHDLLPL